MRNEEQVGIGLTPTTAVLGTYTYKVYAVGEVVGIGQVERERGLPRSEGNFDSVVPSGIGIKEVFHIAQFSYLCLLWDEKAKKGGSAK